MREPEASRQGAEQVRPDAIWQVQLLGGLRATRDATVLAHFPSRAVAMLLARLALEPRRRHAREELIERLWPGVDVEVGRNRLRQALSTLRRLLEPPGDVPGSVLVADRHSISVHEGVLDSDVERFERHLRHGELARALDDYRGELLPGFYDDWIDNERLRLASLADTARSRGSEVATMHPYALDAAPALPSMPATRAAPVRNLPAFVGVFFGREDEQHQVLEALADARLVTLCGLGGCGKTRLAVEAACVAAGFDTVAFAALAECREPSQIGERIRAALRMQAAAGDGLAQLAAFLADRDVLLVLDNFEQLVSAGGADLVVDLLARLPRLRCLVTSRRALDVAGERGIVLGPLPLPAPDMDPGSAARTPSLALFIDRARGARPDFALTARNAPALIRLARALEGLPLAIEIAASRVRSYSPDEMCVALGRRFELLARQGRVRWHGRHASLQAAIAWSWQLLDPAQQRLLAALSVFRGGFTVAAVEAVCATPEAALQLDALVGDSLLRADIDTPGATRFTMLETIREFAHERLDAASARELRRRHRDQALGLARRCAGAATVIDVELPNLQQAMASAVEDDEPRTALAIALALRAHWETRGLPAAAARLLHEAQARCTGDDAQLADALELLAAMAFQAGDSGRAGDYVGRALRCAGGDPRVRGATLVTRARIEWEREQRPEAVLAMLDEALALARAGSLPRLEADALRAWATIVQRHGAADADQGQAAELFAQAEALYRRAGEATWAYRALLARAGCLIAVEQFAPAEPLLDACEAHFGAAGATVDLMVLANMRGFLESGRAQWGAALAAGRRCLGLAWQGHAHLWLAMALWNLPQPLAALGAIEPALRLKAFAARFWVRHIGVLSTDDLASCDSVRASGEQRLGAARCAVLWDAGEQMALADAVALALQEPQS
ncbi:MAG: ATP-binding protein [Betaproteobacteria bacterium]